MCGIGKMSLVQNERRTAKMPGWILEIPGKENEFGLEAAIGRLAKRSVKRLSVKSLQIVRSRCVARRLLMGGGGCRAAAGRK